MAQLQSGSGVLWQVPRGAGEEGADHGLGPGLCPVCVGCLGHHHHVASLTQGWTAAPGVLAALSEGWACGGRVPSPHSSLQSLPGTSGPLLLRVCFLPYSLFLQEFRACVLLRNHLPRAQLGLKGAIFNHYSWQARGPVLLAFCCGRYHTLGYRGGCELGAPAGFTVKVGRHFYQEKPCVLMERHLGLGLRREAEFTSSRGVTTPSCLCGAWQFTTSFCFLLKKMIS